VNRARARPRSPARRSSGSNVFEILVFRRSLDAAGAAARCPSGPFLEPSGPRAVRARRHQVVSRLPCEPNASECRGRENRSSPARSPPGHRGLEETRTRDVESAQPGTNRPRGRSARETALRTTSSSASGVERPRNTRISEDVRAELRRAGDLGRAHESGFTGGVAVDEALRSTSRRSRKAATRSECAHAWEPSLLPPHRPSYPRRMAANEERCRPRYRLAERLRLALIVPVALLIAAWSRSS